MSQGYLPPNWLREALMIKFGPNIGVNHLIVFLMESELARIKPQLDKMTEEEKINYGLNVLCGKIATMEKKNDDNRKARKNVRKHKQASSSKSNPG